MAKNLEPFQVLSEEMCRSQPGLRLMRSGRAKCRSNQQALSALVRGCSRFAGFSWAEFTTYMRQSESREEVTYITSSVRLQSGTFSISAAVKRVVVSSMQDRYKYGNACLLS